MRILIALAGVCLAALPARTQSPNLYTIPNQSAHFVRMPSRESSTEIDAVFHNPAGTVELPEGFHLTINNQGLVQTSRVTSDYAELNDVPTTYEGVASSLVFPSMFAAWRKGRVAFHGGLLMVGGTGGAAYDNLPEADAGIADIVPILLTPALVPLGAANAQIAAASGTDPGYLDLDGYRFAFNSEGLGFSPGLQLGLAYRASRVFSVSFGARVVQQQILATSTLEDVEIYNRTLDAWYAPGDYLRMVAADPNLSPPFPFVLGAVAQGLDADLAPVQLDMRQAGYGLTPIIGLGIRPNDRVNVGIRYEHNTAMTLETTVNDGKDAGGRFTDGERIRSDLPGFVTIGAGWRVSDKLTARIGGRYLFDTQADWNGRDSLVESNYYELALAGEYRVADAWHVSAGYTFNKPSVAPAYQQETDYRLPGHTFAAGGAWDISESFRLNAGVMMTAFVAETNGYTHPVGGNEADPEPFNLTFEKSAVVAAIGLDWHIPSRAGRRMALPEE